jgi:hypothetical protein
MQQHCATEPMLSLTTLLFSTAPDKRRNPDDRRSATNGEAPRF